MNKIDEKLMNKCGIYIFTNLVNGKRYIGSSKNLYNRLHEHKFNLMSNSAHNMHFQCAWNKYGEDSFIYGILEYCSLEEQFNREQFYIDLLVPEYNKSSHVIANTGISLSEETKEKISNTLKQKYASGEIITYKQEHAWVKCYIYNIRTLKHEASCNCKEDAFRLLHCKRRSNDVLSSTIFLGRYIISLEEFIDTNSLQNYINSNVLKCISSFGKYLISESEGEIIYYRSITDCARDNFTSKSTLSKHTNATKENPYIMKKTGNKFYFSDIYYPVNTQAVPIEESSELLQTNIGEGCDANPEISIKSKNFIPSYSVEIEPSIEE